MAPWLREAELDADGLGPAPAIRPSSAVWLQDGLCLLNAEAEGEAKRGGGGEGGWWWRWRRRPCEKGIGGGEARRGVRRDACWDWV